MNCQTKCNVFEKRPHNELKNRGVQDIMVICADGLTGIKEKYPHSKEREPGAGLPMARHGHSQFTKDARFSSRIRELSPAAGPAGHSRFTKDTHFHPGIRELSPSAGPAWHSRFTKDARFSPRIRELSPSAGPAGHSQFTKDTRFPPRIRELSPAACPARKISANALTQSA